MELDGKKRVVIENVKPCIEDARFAVKRVVDEIVKITADIFCDSHDELNGMILYKKKNDYQWKQCPMTIVNNDRWEGYFVPESIGYYLYTVVGWVDHYKSWLHSLNKKYESGQNIQIEAIIGINLIKEIAMNAHGSDLEILLSFTDSLLAAKNDEALVTEANNEKINELIKKYPDMKNATQYDRIIPIVVDKKIALFSSWYEFFPRSSAQNSTVSHGTFSDCEKLLPLIKDMGFNVVYLPPIHPIGLKNRKGKNNSTVKTENDPGSPWAIGAQSGGHKAIENELGGINEFQSFVNLAKSLELEIALDIAFQCSPDHPYVNEHSEWFIKRPDGSIQFAENPPKKYEDIVPFNFESDSWKSLWEELKSIIEYWVGQGINIFRIDNPHTKPFAFWEWLISEVKLKCPDVIFLSEAFTRPKVMYRLAKAGFTQSYTYFTWRNSKSEITEYLRDITRADIADFFRPNFWPNTPDILPQYLQIGGVAAFKIRFILAATLSSNYGIYGPLYELAIDKAMPDREEYLDSEKYEIKKWDWFSNKPLSQLITNINKIRNENKSLQYTNNVTFHEINNNYLLFYSKTTPDLSNIIIVIVNLDPFRTQKSKIYIPLKQFRINPSQTYILDDLLSGKRLYCSSPELEIQSDPEKSPAYLFKVTRTFKDETTYDYY